MAPSAASYDAIVIGAGHNGLTAACALAKRGRSVLVLERREVAGGMCAGEEFHPGYRSAGLLHDSTGVRQWVADDLSLHEHGLARSKAPLRVFSPERDGRGLMLSAHPGEAEDEIGAFSADDARGYRKQSEFIDKVRGVVSDAMNEVPADWLNVGGGGVVKMLGQALSVRRLGRRDMIELIRVAPMCVADWLNEWFETDLLKCSLAAPAILGGWVGPRSPGTSSNLLLWQCLAGNPIEGGPAAVAFALERAAKHLGVALRTSCPVDRIRVGKKGVEGVRLAGGEEIDAPVVMSSLDPKTTFLRLLEPNDIAPKFEGHIRSWRSRGTTAKVNLALDRALEFACRPQANVEYARTGEGLDFMERAFDPVKYRKAAERPVLDIYVPTVSRPELAPDGHCVASVLAHFVPYDYEAGWTDDEREKLGDVVVAELARFAPGVPDSIVAREVLTPLDIERRYGASGGQIHHGEHGLDQIAVRPAPQANRYATPVDGLYLCGSGAHAGGGVSCAPGALAARVVVRTT
jgi:phytoene dehydrogenase-like protein